MSETSVDHGPSEGRVLDLRTLIKLVMAVLAAALALFPIWVLFIPLWLLTGALSYNAPPGIMQDLAQAAVVAVSAVLFVGGVALLFVSAGFVILGIPAALLGWAFGRITLPSSIAAGFLIGLLPWLLILPFDQSLSLNNPTGGIGILAVAGETLAIGMLGALEGFLFWLVWRLLSRRRVPAKRIPGLG